MLKFSLCSSIFVLDLVIILISNALNSLVSFFISVSLVVFYGFSLVLSWKQIPLSSHFAYYSLYEIKWNSYLLWFWKCVLVWEDLYTVCVCPVALMGELDLTWIKPNLSPGSAGSYHHGRRWDWRWRDLSQSQFEPGFPLCSVVITTLLKWGSDPKLLEQKT